MEFLRRYPIICVVASVGCRFIERPDCADSPKANKRYRSTWASGHWSTPGDEAWAVAVEQPTFGKREVSGVMELHDTAIATSGDYRRRVEVDGKHYSHTMNPRLGRALSNCLAAVTVLAPTCMLADAWATALLVLGEHEGVALAREKRIDALFLVPDGSRVREIRFLENGVPVQADTATSINTFTAVSPRCGFRPATKAAPIGITAGFIQRMIRES